MKYIDTHAHLYLDQFKEDRTEMLQRANDMGVEKIFLPNIDQSTIGSLIDLEQHYPRQCFAMMGLHPCSVKENYEEELEVVKDWLVKRSFVAIGEIGLDYYWDKTYIPQQIEAFRLQINWAKKCERPIVIHSRDSLDDTIRIVAEEKTEELEGIFHCFTGTVEQAQKIIDLGFLLGIGGVATFKNSGMDKVIPSIPLESMVLETDAPYLSPVPHRGKRNESSYIPIVARRIADLKHISIAEVAEITTRTAEHLFRHQSVDELTKK